MPLRQSHPADSLITQLRRAPWRFSLEQAVRLLKASGETPTLHGELGLAFGPAEVAGLEAGVLQVRSLGPGGADGVLPYGWLEELQQAAQDKKPAPQDFLHLFTGRLLEHHYRSLSHYRLATPYARRDQAPALGLMRALSGLTADTDSADGVDELTLLACHGGLARRQRSAAGFVALVADVMAIDIQVEEFVGRWQPLPVVTLDRGRCQLGRNAVAGRRAWDQHAALRIHYAAEDDVQWRALLPGTPGFYQLSQLGQIWFGSGIRVEWVMRASLRLDSRLSRTAPPRLGYTAQLAGRHPAAFRCLQPLEENPTWN